MKQFKKDDTYYLIINNDFICKSYKIKHSLQRYNNHPAVINLEIIFMDIPNIKYENSLPERCMNEYHALFSICWNERIVFYCTSTNHYSEYNKCEFDFSKKEADSDIMLDIAEYVLVNGS